MSLWAQVCDAATVPESPCVDPIWVDVSAAVPFTLTEAMIANCGEAFAAGLFIVVFFWGLGYAGGAIIRAIRS